MSAADPTLREDRELRPRGGPLGLLLAVPGRLGALRREPVRAVLYRQLTFSGIQALPKTIVLAITLGFATILQIRHFLGSNAAFTAEAMIWVVARQLAPLFVTLLVVARSVTAIAAELGSMALAGELRTLRSLDIEPLDYLVVPRILGTTLSVVVLCFYFQVVALAGGLLLASSVTELPLTLYLHHVLESLAPRALGAGLLTALFFGAVIGAFACHHGLQVRSSINEVPQRTARAVVQSVVSVVLLQGLLGLIGLGSQG